MRIAAAVACCVVLLSLVGCGGGSSDGKPGERPAGEVSGVAFDGLITNGELNIYAFDGTKGELLASGRTDGVGAYTIALSAPSQPILIEVSGGRYEEEASNRIVQLEDSDRLQAVRFYISGEPLQMAVTYFSTLAAGLAEYLVREQGVTPQNAVELANQRISGIMSLDITRTMPLDVSAPTNKRSSLSPELRYGFLTASVSQWTANASATNSLPVHEPWNSVSFIQLAYDDLSHDGVLNGIGSGGQLTVGTIDMSTEVYRRQLALSLMEYVVSQNNATELPMAELRPAIETFNSAADEIFDGVAASAIDFNGTTVADFLPAENSTVFGSFAASARLLNEVGLDRVHFEIDSAPVLGRAVENVDAPMQLIDSTLYADEEYTLSLVVINALGTKQSFDRIITIYNAAPSVTNVVPPADARLSGTITASATISDSYGVASVQFLIDGEPLAGSLDTSLPELAIDTVALELTDGDHTFSVVATGDNDAVRQIDQPIMTNNSPPTISGFVPSNGSLLRGKFTAQAVLDDLFGIESAEFLIDNSIAAVASVPVPAAPTTSVNGALLSDGVHQISIRATGAVTGLQSLATHNVTTDNNGPVVTVIDPISSDAVAGVGLMDPPLSGTQCPCFPMRFNPVAGGQGCDFLVRATDVISSPGQLQLSSPESAAFTSTRSNVFRGFTTILQPGCRNVAVTVRDQAGNATLRTVTVCRNEIPNPLGEGGALRYCEAQ